MTRLLGYSSSDSSSLESIVRAGLLPPSTASTAAFAASLTGHINNGVFAVVANGPLYPLLRLSSAPSPPRLNPHSLTSTPDDKQDPSSVDPPSIPSTIKAPSQTALLSLLSASPSVADFYSLIESNPPSPFFRFSSFSSSSGAQRYRHYLLKWARLRPSSEESTLSWARLAKGRLEKSFEVSIQPYPSTYLKHRGWFHSLVPVLNQLNPNGGVLS